MKDEKFLEYSLEELDYHMGQFSETQQFRVVIVQDENGNRILESALSEAKTENERKDEVIRNSEVIVNGYIALVRELEMKGFVPKKQPVTEDLLDYLADCKEALSTEGETE